MAVSRIRGTFQPASSIDTLGVLFMAVNADGRRRLADYGTLSQPGPAQPRRLAVSCLVRDEHAVFLGATWSAAFRNGMVSFGAGVGDGGLKVEVLQKPRHHGLTQAAVLVGGRCAVRKASR
jgi:hypothetical protein